MWTKLAKQAGASRAEIGEAILGVCLPDEDGDRQRHGGRRIDLAGHGGMQQARGNVGARGTNEQESERCEAFTPEGWKVTTPLVSKLSGGLHLERLEVSRLRATWVSCCAERIGLKAFMSAAGITCSQRLGDVVSSLPALSEQEMVALLGATS